MFELHPAFPPTSEALGDLALCHARLHADARYAWIVLIPRVAGAIELEDLSADERSALAEEIVLAGQAVRQMGAALGRPVQKLNVGQLGNVTGQLHFHIVGRRADDPAWPGPVWGVGRAEPYTPQAQTTALQAAQAVFGLNGDGPDIPAEPEVIRALLREISRQLRELRMLQDATRTFGIGHNHPPSGIDDLTDEDLDEATAAIATVEAQLDEAEPEPEALDRAANTLQALATRLRQWTAKIVGLLATGAVTAAGGWPIKHFLDTHPEFLAQNLERVASWIHSML